LKRRLISSYTAQAYIGLIGILLMPVYMRYMGIEAVGLIGFFLMMQAWLQLLDLGLTQTLSRDMSLFQVGSMSGADIWRRLRTLEWLLGVVSIVAFISVVLLKNWIAKDWLSLGVLSSDEVAISVAAMAVAAALRFAVGIYRASLTGLGRQVWVNRAAAVFATLKFVGVLPLLVYWSSAPSTFFAYQAMVGGLELLVFAWMLYRVLPANPVGLLPHASALQLMLPMAGAMAFSALIWSVITQADKLILSKLLPLVEYGYFTLGALVASGVLMLIPPLNQVLQPRMTMLLSASRHDELLALYQQATQLVAAVFFAVGGVMALFAEPLLLAWTGDAIASHMAAPILFWYGLANSTIGLLLLPFLLQFAHGQLRLHVIGNILMVMLLLPMMIVGAIRFGGAGTGAALLFANMVFVVFWVPQVHKRFLPELMWRWPLVDVGRVVVPVMVALLATRQLIPDVESRGLTVVLLGLVLLAAIAVGLLFGSRTRGFVLGLRGLRT
jgi:O-antigen/teichoic acid export membrane protein